jgi:hypothetical protein
MKAAHFVCLLMILFSTIAVAQTNPVPFVNQPLVPDAIAPGGKGFTLTINGTGFVSGSQVKWNGKARATKFVSVSRLTARILSSDIATPHTVSVTVVNPEPGGGTSSVAFFEVTKATPSIGLIASAVNTGDIPIWVSIGDFNEDGNLDLSVTNNNSNDTTYISILLGNGDGTFKSPVNYTVGTGPTSVSTGDFNRDGKLDLAVSNIFTNDISVLLGRGDGTFQAARNYPLGGSPWSVTVGDFNADGKLDLVATNADDNAVSVLLGNGDGTFQSAVNYGTGNYPVSVAVGDFNGDGVIDLVVANGITNDISVLLGRGDGTFQPEMRYGAGNAPGPVVVGDFNADGKLDLAVVNSNDNTVGVLLGRGDGTFQPSMNYGVGENPNGVATSDLNGDGKVDLLVANLGNSQTGHTVSVLLGNGDGTFRTAKTYDAGPAPSSVAVGDFNGDGRLDGVVSNYNVGGDTVSVLTQISGPRAILSSTSLRFATQLINTSSPPQPVTLSNYGSRTLKIASIVIKGLDPKDFVQNNDCGSGVPSGGYCTINFTFAPTLRGDRRATALIRDNAPHSPQKISLQGTGTVVKLDATRLVFHCGNGCQPQTVTLSNVASTTLTIKSIKIVGSTHFSETNTCGSRVPPKGSCKITVRYSSSGMQLTSDEEPPFAAATLSIQDDGGGSPQKVFLFEF